jgi:hypothetical protein
MRRPLIQLLPGTRFRLAELDLTETLLAVSITRARVRLDRPLERVEFAGPDGESRASTVTIEAFSVSALDERDLTMAKRPTTKSSAKTADEKPVGVANSESRQRSGGR